MTTAAPTTQQTLKTLKDMSPLRRAVVSKIVSAFSEQEHAEHTLTDAQVREVRQRLSKPAKYVSGKKMQAFFRSLGV